MNVLDSNMDYLLDQFYVETNGLESAIRWRTYGETTHFIIVVTDVFTDYTFDDVKRLLDERDISDETIIKKGNIILSEDDSSVSQLFLISTQQYMQNNLLGWKCTRKQLTDGRKIPLKIAIYACVVENDNQINAYRSSNKENETFFPITIHYTQVTKGIFGNKRVELCIESINQYVNGSLGYKLTEKGIKIPLTIDALGKNLIVKMTVGNEIIVYVEEDYKNFYKLVKKKNT